MTEPQKTKKIILLISLVLLIIVLAYVCLFYKDEDDNFCGIKIKEYSKLKEDYKEVDNISGFQLMYNGVLAPYDKVNKRYLISENINEINWKAILYPNEEKFEIYMCEDDLLRDKKEAVRNANNFRLFVCENDLFEVREVVFTSLPVMNLKQTISTKYSGSLLDSEVYHGNMELFNPNGEGGMCNVKSSKIEYHTRGNTSRVFEKKGIRVNLKDENGKKNNLDLLNMRSDDDWILNAMYSDDEKLRDKLIMRLWEEIRIKEGNKWKFAELEYIELFVNDEYMGLYGLSTRVDAKLENLNREKDAIFQLKNYRAMSEARWKGVTRDTDVVGTFNLDTRPIDLNENPWIPMKIFSQQFFQEDIEFNIDVAKNLIDIQNQIDNSLLINFGYIYDNNVTNNIIYVYDSQSDKFIRLMWDFDGSFSKFTLDENFYIHHETTEEKNKLINKVLTSYEMIKLLEADEDIWNVMCNRWHELRKTVLSTENVVKLINDYRSELYESGVWIREKERWPNEAMVQDSEWLLSFIKERSNYLDSYYNTDNYPIIKDDIEY